MRLSAAPAGDAVIMERLVIAVQVGPGASLGRQCDSARVRNGWRAVQKSSGYGRQRLSHQLGMTLAELSEIPAC